MVVVSLLALTSNRGRALGKEAECGVYTDRGFLYPPTPEHQSSSFAMFGMSLAMSGGTWPVGKRMLSVSPSWAMTILPAGSSQMRAAESLSGMFRVNVA